MSVHLKIRKEDFSSITLSRKDLLHVTDHGLWLLRNPSIRKLKLNRWNVRSKNGKANPCFSGLSMVICLSNIRLFPIASGCRFPVRLLTQSRRRGALPRNKKPELFGLFPFMDYFFNTHSFSLRRQILYRLIKRPIIRWSPSKRWTPSELRINCFSGSRKMAVMILPPFFSMSDQRLINRQPLILAFQFIPSFLSFFKHQLSWRTPR